MSYTLSTYELGTGYTLISGNPQQVETWTIQILTAQPAALVVIDDDNILNNDSGSNEVGSDVTQTALFNGVQTQIYVDVTFQMTDASTGAIYTFGGIDVTSSAAANNDNIWLHLIDSSTGSPPPVGPPLTFVEGSVSGNTDLVFCLCHGTRIRTQSGDVNIENLKVGDAISTLDHGEKNILWIGRKSVKKAEIERNTKLKPIRLMAGSLGEGIPETDLIASRQHRILVSSPIVRRMFGLNAIFTPAIKLRGLPNISLDKVLDEVVYYHILLDTHEVIFANNTPVESLYLGPQIFTGLSDDTFDEVVTLFPELKDSMVFEKTARFVPEGKKLKRLIERHTKNCMPLLEKNYSKKLGAMPKSW